MLDIKQNRASSTMRAKNVIIPQGREVAGDFKELIQSVRDYGMLQPIGVRNANAGKTLVWGCKRLKAVLSIDAEAEIEIIDLGDLTDDEAAVAEIEENARRHRYTEEERAKATARSVALRCKILEARKALSGQNVEKLNGRPAQTKNEAIRAEAASQGVSTKTIERNLKNIGAGVDPVKSTANAKLFGTPRATGKVTKSKGTTLESLKRAFDGAAKATQRKLIEYAANEMDAAEWSKFIAELPRKDLPMAAVR
jgi:ParB-like chromosome segregation protein Spo0J